MLQGEWNRQSIEQAVLEALATTNAARPEGEQLEVSPTAPIFGHRSRLDSLGLVALLIDVEDILREQGLAVTLTDERAVSQRRSPFRSVPTLVEYIASLAGLAQ